MDGYEVVVGDPVFDILFGAGKIDRLVKQENSFWVNFGNRMQHYTNQGQGQFRPVRTLYWRDPITVPPHKDDSVWINTLLIAQSVAKILKDNK